MAVAPRWVGPALPIVGDCRGATTLEEFGRSVLLSELVPIVGRRRRGLLRVRRELPAAAARWPGFGWPSCDRGGDQSAWARRWSAQCAQERRMIIFSNDLKPEYMRIESGWEGDNNKPGQANRSLYAFRQGIIAGSARDRPSVSPSGPRKHKLFERLVEPDRGHEPRKYCWRKP